MGLFQKIRHKTDFFLLIGLVAAYCLFNYIWVIDETRPPHWDMARHLWTSLLYLQQLHFKTFYRLWTNYYYYPPLRYWLTIPFYLLFGTSMTVAIMSNVVFVFIMAFSVYGIGLELWNRSAGLLAALYVLALPMFVSQFKEYQLDAQLSAMVALSFYALIKTREFSDYHWSLFFGLSFGLGMLTKWTFFNCMTVPLAYSLWKTLWSRKNENSKVVSNICWSALIAVGVSLLWYGNHPRMLKNDFFGNGVKSGDAPWYNFGSLTWYVLGFESIQAYLLPTVLFIVGLGITFFRKHKSNTYPLLLVFGSYLLLLPLHKDVRYSMPMLIGGAVLSVYWIPLLKTHWLRRTMTAFVVFYSFFSFWGVSFGFPFLPKEMKWGPLLVFSQGGYSTACPPTKEQWHQEDLFKVISQYPEKERDLRADCLDTMWFNSWGFRYYAEKYGIPLTFNDEKTTFLVQRRDKPFDTPSGYGLIQQFELPDKSILCLFKRKNS